MYYLSAYSNIADYSSAGFLSAARCGQDTASKPLCHKSWAWSIDAHDTHWETIFVVLKISQWWIVYSFHFHVFPQFFYFLEGKPRGKDWIHKVHPCASKNSEAHWEGIAGDMCLHVLSPWCVWKMKSSTRLCRLTLRTSGCRQRQKCWICSCVRRWTVAGTSPSVWKVSLF